MNENPRDGQEEFILPNSDRSKDVRKSQQPVSHVIHMPPGKQNKIPNKENQEALKSNQAQKPIHTLPAQIKIQEVEQN